MYRQISKWIYVYSIIVFLITLPLLIIYSSEENNINTYSVNNTYPLTNYISKPFHLLIKNQEYVNITDIQIFSTTTEDIGFSVVLINILYLLFFLTSIRFKKYYKQNNNFNNFNNFVNEIIFSLMYYTIMVILSILTFKNTCEYANYCFKIITPLYPLLLFHQLLFGLIATFTLIIYIPIKIYDCCCNSMPFEYSPI
ncbi:MAG: hypothetical protein Edafosvirus21_5 [Edafosvirus sp.]|uniref:Uncharacterized protein n=1 Tax=Edafosvirus sp. TaxID=2487765 RepID=A0A3G4ZUP3_9VIRU|nr:MAG: hypothetical protein Edafosvirus21_5 [Edafosvirus sp.]